jgi:uncharacterized membrane protein YfcA
LMQPWQWALAALAAYTVGVSKTGVAGLGLLAVAMFASALPARESTGLVLVILLAGDIVAASVYRHEVCRQQLLRLLPAITVGVAAGYLVMDQIDAHMTQKLIGVVVVLLALASTLRMPGGLAPNAEFARFARPVGWALAIAIGVSAGFASMVANAAGPLIVAYLLILRLPKALLMGTTAWCFLLTNMIKLPFSYSLGLINGTSLPVSMLLAPFAAAGALSGTLFLRRADQRVFEYITLLLTLLAGLRLLAG